MSDSEEKTTTQEHNSTAAAKKKLQAKKRRKKAYQWSPHDDEDEGDTVEGKVVDFEWVPTSNPKWNDMPILYIQEESRDVYTALPSMHTVLQSQLGEVDVEMGDYIIVSYVGERTPENGDSYHEYIVAKPGEEEEEETDVSEVFGQ